MTGTRAATFASLTDVAWILDVGGGLVRDPFSVEPLHYVERHIDPSRHPSGRDHAVEDDTVDNDRRVHRLEKVMGTPMCGTTDLP